MLVLEILGNYDALDLANKGVSCSCAPLVNPSNDRYYLKMFVICDIDFLNTNYKC